MTNQQGWKKLSAKFAGQTLTAQVLNALFNRTFGTTGDHYPGDYAFVIDKRAITAANPLGIVPATTTQANGGYDAIFLRCDAAATYKVLAPEDQISHPRAGKGRGRGANLLSAEALDSAVAKAIAMAESPSGAGLVNGVPKTKGKEQHKDSVSGQ